MSWPKGKPRSKETKSKISAWMMANKPTLGKHLSDEAKHKLSIAMSLRLQGNKRRLGIPHTEETKQRIGEASRAQWASRIDRHQTAEHIKHNADARRGYHHSEETKGKMREASKTKPPVSEATRRKMSESLSGEKNPMFGKHPGDETRKKMSRPLDKNPRWTGGLSRFPYPITFNGELKERIRTRDHHICQLCGVTQGELVRKLDVHHIDHNKDNLCDTNLISLCRRCNSRVNSNREHWQSYFNQVIAEV